ncbi:hypothetical protein SADUNF_Sadunf16G0033600 [Salix dunnii]|uniref:Uncharacterized protein n=1 Tax=Salix dunnii TaxID=1413687 RepID=A0A835MP78_9ROSI|nr:hypothetical protein SADUNF_Sadunf16G0033600 [Salix dunnii]
MRACAHLLFCGKQKFTFYGNLERGVSGLATSYKLVAILQGCPRTSGSQPYTLTRSEIEDERETRSPRDSFRDHSALVVETLGICDIELRANKTRRDMIMTGTKRRANGGGGNGGSTSVDEFSFSSQIAPAHRDFQLITQFHGPPLM